MQSEQPKDAINGGRKAEPCIKSFLFGAASPGTLALPWTTIFQPRLGIAKGSRDTFSSFKNFASLHSPREHRVSDIDPT